MSVTIVATPAAHQSMAPHLSVSENSTLLSWLKEHDDGTHSLMFSRFEGTHWSESTTVTTRDDLFVNWADIPSVERLDEDLWAHWLQRNGDGTYAYGVRIAVSTDGGTTWGNPLRPHEDETPTEHGFVSLIEDPAGGIGALWLDGRAFVDSEYGPATREMAVRYRSVGVASALGPEEAVSLRTCDCCPTDAVVSSSGPIAVFRGRSQDEVRDIQVTRRVDGLWTEPSPVHDDGWRIEGCPVNGPAIAAGPNQIAVAWFTAAGDVPRVKVALSNDEGRTFGLPTQIDGGNPLGRVDVVVTEDGATWVSWLERVTPEKAELKVRRVEPDGVIDEPIVIAQVNAARSSGIPQMVVANGGLLFAWTATEGMETRVLTAFTELPQ